MEYPEHTLAHLLNNLDRCRDLSSFNKRTIKKALELHGLEAKRLVWEEAEASLEQYKLENPHMHSSTAAAKIKS